MHKINVVAREDVLGYKVNGIAREDALGYKVNGIAREDALGYNIYSSANLEVSHSGQLHTPGKRDPFGSKGSNPFTSACAKNRR